MFTAAVLIVTLGAALPAAATPQGDPGAALARIPSGTLIRIGLTGGEQVEGLLRTLTADSVLLTGAASARWLALEQIGEVHERGRATKTAAIAGAVVGGVVTGTLVTVACSIGRSDDGVIGNEGQWADCAAVGAVLGGVGGAAIGAGIGLLIPQWHVRFRSSR